MKAIEFHLRYDRNEAAVIKELGYSNRNAPHILAQTTDNGAVAVHPPCRFTLLQVALHHRGLGSIQPAVPLLSPFISMVHPFSRVGPAPSPPERHFPRLNRARPAKSDSETKVFE